MAAAPLKVTDASSRLLPQIRTFVPGPPEAGWKFLACGAGTGRPSSTRIWCPRHRGRRTRRAVQIAIAALYEPAGAHAFVVIHDQERGVLERGREHEDGSRVRLPSRAAAVRDTVEIAVAGLEHRAGEGTAALRGEGIEQRVLAGESDAVEGTVPFAAGDGIAVEIAVARLEQAGYPIRGC